MAVSPRPEVTDEIRIRTRLTAKIREDHAAMLKTLETIAPPSGHRWMAQGDALDWWDGDVIESVRGIGPSICLRRDPLCDEDPDQLFVEVRLSWNDPGQMPGLEFLRCILWCSHGRRTNFESVGLLQQGAIFLRAATADELFRDIASRLDAAFHLYQVRRAEPKIRGAEPLVEVRDLRPLP